jgi:hypothetical protein
MEVNPVWWPGLKNSPTVTYACRKRLLKWVPSAWGYSWATLSPGVIDTEAWFSRLGLGGGLTIQPCKKVIVTKPQKRGGQGPTWSVEPYDNDDDGDIEVNKKRVNFYVMNYKSSSSPLLVSSNIGEVIF